MLSKDGLNWIQLAPLPNSTPTGIFRWVLNGSTTYGLGGFSTNIFSVSSDTTPEVVGLPYSLTTLALNANKYLRVK